jgi:hypothetical protein
MHEDPVAELYATGNQPSGDPSRCVHELGITPNLSVTLEWLPYKKRVVAPHFGLPLQQVRDIEVREWVKIAG